MQFIGSFNRGETLLAIPRGSTTCRSRQILSAACARGKVISNMNALITAPGRQAISRARRLRPYAPGADVIVVEVSVITEMITTSRPLNPRSQVEVVELEVAEEANHAAAGSLKAAPLPRLGLLVREEEAREVPAAERGKAKEKAKEREREATSRPAVPIAH